MIIQYNPRLKKRINKYLDEENKKIFADPHYKKFLLRKNKEILGWVVIEKSLDRLLIEWMFVRKEFRNQNVGSILLKEIIKYAKKQKFRGISVNTGNKNKGAQRFYKRHGFKKVGEVKKFFKIDSKHIFFWYQSR